MVYINHEHRPVHVYSSHGLYYSRRQTCPCAQLTWFILITKTDLSMCTAHMVYINHEHRPVHVYSSHGLFLPVSYHVWWIVIDDVQ